jgi:DNA polymerase-3 subunit epsilon
MTQSIDSVRFVVLDTETTGLNPKRDQIITIGAVAVQNNQIVLEDSLELLLRIAWNGASVTVHGITRDEALVGMSEYDAMVHFLPYVGNDVIVGHHIGHDITALNEACKRHFDRELQNQVIDTMELALQLQEAGWSPEGGLPGFSLDDLCRTFSIPPHDRHTAGGDAFLTAQIFLRLLRIAANLGRHTLADLLPVAH